MDMVYALLEREKGASVVVIDWRGGSSPPYAKAATNIRLVGAMAAHVVHLIYVKHIFLFVFAMKSTFLTLTIEIIKSF